MHRARDSGLPRDRVYILDGEVDGHVSYAGLVKRVQQNRVPRLEIRPANGDTLAGLILSSGTTGLPKGERSLSRVFRFGLASYLPRRLSTLVGNCFSYQSLSHQLSWSLMAISLRRYFNS